MNPRALEELFAVAKERALDWTYEITMSVLEIYNEQIRDLLGENPSAKMEIRQHPEGHLYVPGLCWVQVASRVDVQEVKEERGIGNPEDPLFYVSLGF